MTKKDGDRVNAKSIMGIMMLAAARGSELTFECSHSEASELENKCLIFLRPNFRTSKLPYFTEARFLSWYRCLGYPILVKVFDQLLYFRRSLLGFCVQVIFSHHPEETTGGKISFQKPLRQMH